MITTIGTLRWVVAMTRVVTADEVLDGHVALDIECLDRVYLNAYVPILQSSGQVVAFMTQHLGLPIPSPALFDKIGQKFRRAVVSFAEANGIPWVKFAKEDRKAEVMAPYLKRAAATGRPQVAAIGVAQEFQRVWTAYRRETSTAAPQFTFAKADRRVTCYYFYLWDAGFGPAFIKVCAYFPYPGKVYLLTELRRDLPGRADEREGEGLPSLLVIGSGGERDLAVLVVPQAGTLRATGHLFEPYQLVGPSGEVVSPAAAFLTDLQACGRPETTQRSYGMDLLRWFRFVWAVGVPWDQATRAEARDFIRWLQVAGKPARPHWRHPGGPVPSRPAARPAPNPVTGKAPPGPGYAPATVAHCETVARGFYEFCLQAGTGPMMNPFPLARGRGRRAAVHRNPMEPFRAERTGLFRPKLARRRPRQIPDEKFSELFAALGSHRDRALVAFWVSAGVRASELLGATQGDADPGQQLITVVRKGSRALQPVPASADAFVWLRLYQAQMAGLVPSGRDQPLWWTLRRPFRPLAYHAAHRMFTRASAALGANWSLHDLRHTAAYRMARDPQMPLTDVQWVLGHAHLSTTGLYMSPLPEDVITDVLAFHQRRAGQQATPSRPAPAGYRAESLNVLFGPGRW